VSEIETINAFIAAINAHDIPTLSALMTDDHTFTDVNRMG